MRKLGYARCSTVEQNLDRQITALTDAGCTLIFQEKLSGKNTNRPELTKMIACLREGDVVVVQKLDRLGRSLIDLIKIVDGFREKGVGFISLNDSFDTTTAQGKFIFQVVGAFAELERNMILERVNDGIKNARAKGKMHGRPATLKNEKEKTMFTLGVQAGMHWTELAKKFKMSRNSVYRMMRDMKLTKTYQTKQSI
jgi:DNA invertase Pin-like site-specific DNA recombinase